MQIHGRTRALIGVLATAFCLAIPASAFAGHDLGIYKVEKHVDLTSDETAVDLSCQTGDYALDGMWRIDHADQDDDDIYVTSIGRAVDVVQSYPFDSPGAPAHVDSYHFLFEKNAIGRAQVKVFATCIKDQTEQSGGHSHPIPVEPLQSFTTGAGVGTFTTVPTASCTTNAFVAQTGFKINVLPGGADPNPFVGHLQESRPKNGTDLTAWTWKMDLSQQPADTVTWYWSCVRKKLSTQVPGPVTEKHKLVYRLQGGEANSLAANRVSTKRISCAAHYKAVVAGFTLWQYPVGPPPVAPGTMADPNTDFGIVPKWWYLGMDPQPKSRDFRFLNSDSVASPSGVPTLYAICLNYRTT